MKNWCNSLDYVNSCNLFSPPPFAKGGERSNQDPRCLLFFWGYSSVIIFFVFCNHSGVDWESSECIRWTRNCGFRDAAVLQQTRQCLHQRIYHLRPPQETPLFRAISGSFFWNQTSSTRFKHLYSISWVDRKFFSYNSHLWPIHFIHSKYCIWYSLTSFLLVWFALVAT